MWIAAAAIMVLVMMWFLLSPYFEPASSVAQSEGVGRERLSLLDAKERAMRALKDLELDFAMGKLSAEDFEFGKRSLTVECAGILKELKHNEGR